jgi:hypothetical protein
MLLLWAGENFLITVKFSELDAKLPIESPNA